MEPSNANRAALSGWRFNNKERTWLAVALFVLLGFGVNLEQRTALRRTPMTDLGVFSCAAWAVLNGDNLYTISEWHGWHYGYPPVMAILFTPLAEPIPAGRPSLAPGVPRTEANTLWGYGIDSHRRFYGLHKDNARFFCIVAIWYVVSLVLVFLAAHALACALEGSRLRDPPPVEPNRRRRWWALRTLPMLVCIGSIGTDLSRGQVDVVMLAAIALALYLAVRGRGFGSGVCLAFPAAVKLFPGLLLLYPVWRRKWRMVAGVAAGLFLALVLIPAVALGPNRTVSLYRVWVQVLLKPGLGQGADTSRADELTSMTKTDNQSLLAFIHNWHYHDLPRNKRPSEAAAATRHAVYAIGVLLLLGIGLVSGIRRQDSPRDLFILTGLLIGLALVVCPVVHNYYYLLLLPLVAALLDRNLAEPRDPARIWKLPLVVLIFMLTDMLARLPTIGAYLRDWGLPLLSMIWMLGAGAMLLWKQETFATTLQSPADPAPSDTRIKAVNTRPV